MTKRYEIYKCEICGQIIKVYQGGAHPVCCGQKMTLMDPMKSEGAGEKHIPVIEAVDGGYRVVVGEVEHPMNDDHYIQWIELNVEGGEVYTKFLNPGEKPEAFFKTDKKAVSATAYCNLHGNWQKDI